jgi:hypothetical protein
LHAANLFLNQYLTNTLKRKKKPCLNQPDWIQLDGGKWMIQDDLAISAIANRLNAIPILADLDLSLKLQHRAAGTGHLRELAFRELVVRCNNPDTNHAIPMSNLSHRNTTGSYFISSMSLRILSLRSSKDLTRIWRKNVRAIFEKVHSLRWLFVVKTTVLHYKTCLLLKNTTAVFGVLGAAAPKTVA